LTEFLLENSLRVISTQRANSILRQWTCVKSPLQLLLLFGGQCWLATAAWPGFQSSRSLVVVASYPHLNRPSTQARDCRDLRSSVALLGQEHSSQSSGTIGDRFALNQPVQPLLCMMRVDFHERLRQSQNRNDRKSHRSHRADDAQKAQVGFIARKQIQRTV
jgi:hypothetical protein